MKRNILSICTLVAALTMGSTALTSCDDPQELQDMVLARVLSPTNLSARITNQTDIILTWDEMSGATSYEIEAYADAPDYDNRTPDVSATTTLTSDTLTQLLGETTYYIRIRAIDAEDASRNSKWATIERTTNPEQNMNKVKSGDIMGKSVTLTWTPGIDVDKIIITPSTAGSTAETVEYTLTEEDIANGSATVSGLTPETSYRATLMWGEKTRGYATFTTNIDFSDATVITADDDWVSAIENAPAGSKLALAPGNYVYSDEKLKINADLQIGAQDPANLPVLNTCIHLYNGASLLLNQIILDGTGTDGSQALEYKSEGGFGDLTLKGCEIRNYVKGMIYINMAATPNTITIDNCLIHDIECTGGDFIDSRKGGWNQLNLTNSTIYESAGKRDVIRLDDTSGSVSCKAETTIDHCTFYNVGNGEANYRIFYSRFAGNVNTFKNNVVVNFNNKRGFGNDNDGLTNAPSFSNNYYFNCHHLTAAEDGSGAAFYDEDGTVLESNPFADPDNGDFTITDEVLQSYQFGDPRWF